MLNQRKQTFELNMDENNAKIQLNQIDVSEKFQVFVRENVSRRKSSPYGIVASHLMKFSSNLVATSDVVRACVCIYLAFSSCLDFSIFVYTYICT